MANPRLTPKQKEALAALKRGADPSTINPRTIVALQQKGVLEFKRGGRKTFYTPRTQTKPEKVVEYRSDLSPSDEQIANKLIRQYERNMNPRYRGRIDRNRIRANVAKMSPEVKQIAIAISDDHLMYEAMMGDHTDDDGNNLFWYH